MDYQERPVENESPAKAGVEPKKHSKWRNRHGDCACGCQIRRSQWAKGEEYGEGIPQLRRHVRLLDVYNEKSAGPSIRSLRGPLQ